jgi:hypothetical protein
VILLPRAVRVYFATQPTNLRQSIRFSAPADALASIHKSISPTYCRASPAAFASRTCRRCCRPGGRLRAPVGPRPKAEPPAMTAAGVQAGRGQFAVTRPDAHVEDDAEASPSEVVAVITRSSNRDRSSALSARSSASK